MISDYYHCQYSKQQNNVKSIKLKAHQFTLQPFMIPEEHFNPNKKIYDNLKDRCQKIKTEFSFIKSQIQREHKKKKQKQEELLRVSKSIVNKENREEIQKQMGLTCQKLLRLNQLRRCSAQEIQTKVNRKNNQPQISSVFGQTVSFSPRKHSADKGILRYVINSPKSHFRHSMTDQ